MIVFISGPMTGLPNFNREAFFKAADLMADVGHVVLHPAHHPDGLQHEQYLHICKAMIDCADMLVQLPGWEQSKGARIEFEHARSRGLRIAQLKCI